MKIVKVESNPPVPLPRPLKITVELDEYEITFINLIMKKIGGDPETSYRKHADSILKATETVVEKDASLQSLSKKISNKVDRSNPSSIFFLQGE